MSQLVGRNGKITFFRVHARGSGYGPPSDFIDGEVVIKLNTHPNEAYGFPLRPDDGGPARQAMFELLRLAFKENYTVNLDVYMYPNRQNGILHRASISR